MQLLHCLLESTRCQIRQHGDRVIDIAVDQDAIITRCAVQHVIDNLVFAAGMADADAQTMKVL